MLTKVKPEDTLSGYQTFLQPIIKVRSNKYDIGIFLHIHRLMIFKGSQINEMQSRKTLSKFHSAEPRSNMAKLQFKVMIENNCIQLSFIQTQNIVRMCAGHKDEDYFFHLHKCITYIHCIRNNKFIFHNM